MHGALDIAGLAGRLRGSRDWNAVAEQTRALVSASPPAALEIADVLDADLAEHGHDLAVWSVRDRLLTLVCAVPGSAATLVAVRLAARPAPDVDSAADPRRLAAMYVAGTRPAEDLLGLLGDSGAGGAAGGGRLAAADPELGLLLAHELVLHGESLGEIGAPYRQWAEREQYALAVLPLELTDVELELPRWLPRYPGAQPGDPTPDAWHPPARPLGELLVGVGRRTARGPRHAAAAFDDWVQHSNGQVDVSTFEPGRGFAFAAGAPPAMRANRRAREVPIEQVCGRLFAATRGGGAYSRGPGGAFARLAMWTSLAGFGGLAWPAALDAVRATARSARWIALEPTDPWFYDVFWDEWLLAESEGRLTVVAATDTD